MRTLIFLIVIFIVGIFVGVGFYYVTRPPFNTKYADAVRMYETQEYESALPTLKKGVDVYRNSPHYSSAVYWYAACVSKMSPTNAAVWNDLLNTDIPHEVWREEARYHLARLHTQPHAAMQAFVNEFPHSIYAPDFLSVLAAKAVAGKDRLAEWKMLQTLVDHHSRSIDNPDEIIEKLGTINMKLLCSPRPLPFTTHHEVKQGEYLSTIANKHGTGVDSIKRINALSSDTIRPGTRLKIDLSAYIIEVDISDKKMILSRVHEGTTNFIKRYTVGTGKHDNTPRGNFKVIVKEKEPTWYKPGAGKIAYGDEENLLGTRWIGIDCPGFGIHGTWEPETVGKASSMGCVRMVNSDVEELFDIVSSGTPVIIQE